MKFSRKDVYTNTSAIPSINFEDQQLTSYAGLVVIQKLFAKMSLREKFANCFTHLKSKTVYRPHTIVQCLVLHLILGYRALQDIDYYHDDPLVKRVLGLRVLPSISTFSRVLGEMDERGVASLQDLNRQEVLNGIAARNLRRLTIDFDGSVQSTKRRAEGTAVGYNPRKKGNRSYYPLFCTIAQTGQTFDLLHRSGNVHDSKEAIDFVQDCLRRIREALPGVILEVRMDGAFFSDAMVGALEELGVEFTISVPFERFVDLKQIILGRWIWWSLQGTGGRVQYFEKTWKPKSWRNRHRFIFIRKDAPIQRKEPVQLDFFEPQEVGYEDKVIVTNKTCGPKKVVRCHEGRGQQENVFGEMKSQGQLDYTPCRKRIGNKVYLWSAIWAHNLGRTLQMQCNHVRRSTTEKRSPCWIFEKLGCMRRKFIQRAGRLTRPDGKLTLTMSPNRAVEESLLHYLQI